MSKPKKLNCDSLYPSYTTTASEVSTLKTPRTNRTNLVANNNSFAQDKSFNSSRINYTTVNTTTNHVDRIQGFSNQYQKNLMILINLR